MTRLWRIFLLFAALLASPALAEAPSRLQPLEQRLVGLATTSGGTDVGIAAFNLNTGEFVGINANEPFPMASVVKVAVAANYLSQVEHGRRSLDRLIHGRTAATLLDRMMVYSDNQATDELMRDLGGPSTLQTWLSGVGVSGLRIDRNIAHLLSDRRDLGDLRDSSTPRAMVDLLRRIDNGSIINRESRSYLMALMARCKTGKNRIRALLPYGTLVQHKTGTLSGLTNDVGFITLPNGQRLAVAIFARRITNRPGTIATAARAIYDAFAGFTLPGLQGFGSGAYSIVTPNGGAQR